MINLSLSKISEEEKKNLEPDNLVKSDGFYGFSNGDRSEEKADPR